MWPTWSKDPLLACLTANRGSVQVRVKAMKAEFLCTCQETLFKARPPRSWNGNHRTDALGTLVTLGVK